MAGRGYGSSRRKVYREFLIYTTFYAAQKPVVLCEGETDSIYLTHAIRKLASEYPALAEETQDGKIRLKVRLYKYARSSSARLLGLNDGGSGVLSKFIEGYRKAIERFIGPGLAEPVVVLYDNDSGATKIRSTIKSAYKIKLTGDERFAHVFKNLYAVPTPLGSEKESKIEDFFDDTTRATVIDGKTFKVDNDFDTEEHYGKKVFAHRVVRPYAETIDFTGFRPLLNNLVAAINAHKVSAPELIDSSHQPAPLGPLADSAL